MHHTKPAAVSLRSQSIRLFGVRCPDFSVIEINEKSYCTSSPPCSLNIPPAAELCKDRDKVGYPGMEVPTSYRVPGAKSNLGAGWTSRLRGISTFIDGSGNTSFIQLKNKKRLLLVDSGKQPVVGRLIVDNEPLELGWGGVIRKGGAVKTVRGPDGKEYDLRPSSQALKGKTLSKLGGNKVSHKSKHSFTTWKHEKWMGTENSEKEMVGDIVFDMCGGMNCLALGLKRKKIANRFFGTSQLKIMIAQEQ